MGDSQQHHLGCPLEVRFLATSLCERPQAPSQVVRTVGSRAGGSDSVVQSLSRELFATPWTAAHPGSSILHCLLVFDQTHVH